MSKRVFLTLTLYASHGAVTIAQTRLMSIFLPTVVVTFILGLAPALVSIYGYFIWWIFKT